MMLPWLLLVAPTPTPGPSAPSVPGAGVLNTPTLAALLTTALLALMAVFYAMLRGKLRPESALQEIREDRDARLIEVGRQIETLQKAYEMSEEARRNQEVLLRETTMEIGRTVQGVLSALQEARLQARDEWGSGPPAREHQQDA